MELASYETRRHLAPSEIDAFTEKCPICEACGPREPQLAIQENPEIFLLLCRNCFGLSASHMPRREVLDQLYTTYYDQSERGRIIFQNPQRLGRHIVKTASAGLLSERGLRLIDFGGGNGSIAIAAAQLLTQRTRRPVQVKVVDYEPDAPLRQGLVDIEYLRDLKEAPTNCDLVIASGVFEHVPDLRGTLIQLVNKLRMGGVLYARTMYSLPLMRLFGFKMVYPAHVHDLGDRFWSSVPKWLPIPIQLVRSRPGIVETEFRRQPLRTLAAHCFKLPANIECMWTRNPIFKLYGGWEVVLRRTG